MRDQPLATGVRRAPLLGRWSKEDRTWPARANTGQCSGWATGTDGGEAADGMAVARSDATAISLQLGNLGQRYHSFQT